jgi:hypothetical protein
VAGIDRPLREALLAHVAHELGGVLVGDLVQARATPARGEVVLHGGAVELDRALGEV